MSFRKAKCEQAALKVGIYGLAGSGKTFTTLLCAEGLAKLTGKRIAYVDTEFGTSFYCQEVPERTVHPAAFDFDAIYTRSITEVYKEIKGLDSDKYCCVVIDSITHIWEATIAAYSGKFTSIGTIPMTAWGRIKKPYKDIISFLLSSPLHVFILGRQGNEFERDEEKDELVKVGVKMKAESETPFDQHIIIHMETIRRKRDSAIAAFIEKDRTGILSGKTIQFPNYDSLIKPLLYLLGEKQAVAEDTDSVAAQDAEVLSEEENEKQKEGTEIMERMSARIALCASTEELKAIGKEITPQLKKKMTTQQVTDLRDKYLEAEGKLQ